MAEMEKDQIFKIKTSTSWKKTVSIILEIQKPVGFEQGFQNPVTHPVGKVSHLQQVFTFLYFKAKASF